MTQKNADDRLVGILNRFRKNQDGIAAVEFALVVPLLLAMYLGTVEISNAITVNKQTSRVASTVADLVTQQPATAKTDLNAMMDIGAAVYYPYTAAKPVITVVGVDVDDDHPQGGEVVWSRSLDKGSYNAGISAGTKIFVPEKLRIDETFLIKVVSEIEYRPVVTWVIGSKTDMDGNSYTALDMSEEYWLRPRLSDTIPCTDC